MLSLASVFVVPVVLAGAGCPNENPPDVEAGAPNGLLMALDVSVATPKPKPTGFPMLPPPGLVFPNALLAPKPPNPLLDAGGVDGVGADDSFSEEPKPPKGLVVVAEVPNVNGEDAGCEEEELSAGFVPKRLFVVEVVAGLKKPVAGVVVDEPEPLDTSDEGFTTENGNEGVADVDGDGAVDEKLKGEVFDVDLPASNVGVKPPEPEPLLVVAEFFTEALERFPKPLKEEGGVGIVDFTAALEVSFWSYSLCKPTRSSLYRSRRPPMSTKGSSSTAFETVDTNETFSPRRDV